MGPHSKIRDLDFTESGDFFLDAERNDLKDTKGQPLRALLNRVKNRLISNRGDWSLAPNVGANLKDYQGYENTERIGNLIKASIEQELTRGGLLSSQEFTTLVFPLNQNTIAAHVTVKPRGEKTVETFVIQIDLRKNKIAEG